MNFPDKLKYTKDHEWAKLDGDVVVVGISDFAQHELGDIVFVELPAVGKKLAAGDTFGVAESVKTVSDLYSPVAGEVMEINAELETAPEKVNKDCYGAGWMVKIKPANKGDLDSLLSASSYKAVVSAGH
ncbi:MAG: glycine cleavage system protein GcvH [Nitrospinae bacterium]|nr:glycine cleavage system protein GcvH [Nitrospinota bacterium]